MEVILPDDVSYQNLDKLDCCYYDTKVCFNGHYYTHTKNIHLKPNQNRCYQIVTHNLDLESWTPLKAHDELIASHHYITDSSYNFIASFLTSNGKILINWDETHLLSKYISRSCYYFKTLPYNTKSRIKYKGRCVFTDYTKIDAI